MHFDIPCPECGQTIRLANTLSGGQARCPECKQVFAVPRPVADQPRSSADLWTIRTPENQSFGPVSKLKLDQWVAEGRLTSDCQVLREGSDQWQWATDIFPGLGATTGATTGAASAPSLHSHSHGPYTSPGYSAHATSAAASGEMPGKVQAVKVMLIVGGVIALGNVALMAVSTLCMWVCGWVTWPYGVVFGIMAIVRGSGLGENRVPPIGIVVMQIINIINFDVINLTMGIVNLVLLNEEESKKYLHGNH